MRLASICCVVNFRHADPIPNVGLSKLLIVWDYMCGVDETRLGESG